MKPRTNGPSASGPEVRGGSAAALPPAHLVGGLAVVHRRADQHLLAKDALRLGVVSVTGLVDKGVPPHVARPVRRNRKIARFIEWVYNTNRLHSAPAKAAGVPDFICDPR